MADGNIVGVSADSTWTTWSVAARNLPEHAGNPIHTDAGARDAGYPRALVAGVTTYAYLTQPVLAAWGLEWVELGRGEVRFVSPVFDGETVSCVPAELGSDGVVRIDAIAGDDGGSRARLDVSLGVAAPEPARGGEELEPDWVVLTGEYGSGYGARAGVVDDLCHRAGVVHPAVWPALANRLVHRQVVHGPWVHVRSRIGHHAMVPDGAVAELRGVVVERMERSNGEWAVVDVQVLVDDVVAVSIEHEAIVALP